MGLLRTARLNRAWGPTVKEQRTAFNKYNAPEILTALIKALEVAGLDETVVKLKQMGVTRMINDAWNNREDR